MTAGKWLNISGERCAASTIADEVCIEKLMLLQKVPEAKRLVRSRLA
jgi:hypothetical protein